MRCACASNNLWPMSALSSQMTMVHIPTSLPTTCVSLTWIPLLQLIWHCIICDVKGLAWAVEVGTESKLRWCEDEEKEKLEVVVHQSGICVLTPPPADNLDSWSGHGTWLVSYSYINRRLNLGREGSTGKGETRAHFHRTFHRGIWFIFQKEVSGLYIWLILVRKNAGKAGLNGKVRATRDSFEWKIPGIQYLAYLNGRLNLR